MKKVIFVGWIAEGETPVVGETVKNQYIIAELQKYCKVISLDFYEKKRHPWIYIQAVATFLFYRKAPVIFSTSAQNVYSFIKILQSLCIKRQIIHWVVGGAFPQHIKNGHFKKSVFNYVDLNLVQCHGMVSELEKMGITNVKFVSNFKKIGYYPSIESILKSRQQNKIIKFVFLSRIHPAKGCDYIIQATDKLNKKGYQNSFIVDFYGKIEKTYKSDFLGKIEQIANISYCGLLNLKEPKGYDVLAGYNAMLFPTFHPSEGFAGIFIDAFVAGLPVLASDWSYNSECIKDGELGILYPVHDIDKLTEVMENCIIGKINLNSMAINARREAPKYDAKNVLNKSFIKEIGLID